MLPRPIEHLNAALKLYPSVGELVQTFYESRGKDGIPNWPSWCFLPMAGWYAVVCKDNGGIPILPISLVPDVARIAAIGTWRYSQGIYRVDADLLDALTSSTVKGSLPCEVLYRLPEWAVYVETANLKWNSLNLYGFWAHLEWDANEERVELRLLLDCEEALIPIPIHLGPWTITEAIDRFVQVSGQDIGMDFVQSLAAEINPLISVLLYLCSEEPEIDSEQEPGTHPSKARPKKTKKGWRFFPPARSKVWKVGTTIGHQLRQTSTQGEGDGRGVRPHLRRGHWHGYWIGPLKGPRKFVYRWISPLIVRGSKDVEDTQSNR